MSAVINREHKDRLFAFIFGCHENRRWTLELYNALNGSNHNNAEDIEFNTIEDVIYMGMKNDVSFILYDYMNLYEKQSSYNPNMPLRKLMYVGKLYDKYIHGKRLNIYGEKKVKIPIPKLLVFYNGEKDIKDKTLNLYDLFDNKQKADEADITVRVRLININHKNNSRLLNACKPLNEYSWFIERIRNHKITMNIEVAVDMAINEMPEGYEIRNFLIQHRAEGARRPGDVCFAPTGTKWR